MAGPRGPRRKGAAPRKGELRCSATAATVGALLAVLLGAAAVGWQWQAGRGARHGTRRIMAPASQAVAMRQELVPCQPPVAGHKVFPGCSPRDVCGRFVSDEVILGNETAALLQLVEAGMQLGRPAGGPTILDLHSGALSYDTGFIDVFKAARAAGQDALFGPASFQAYATIEAKVRAAVVEAFGVDPGRRPHLTKPTFFSRITDRAARTEHDEYWHEHIDQLTYGSFDYTCLLYLATAGSDFAGGAFEFKDADGGVTVVEPRLGRVSCFTSGPENPHYVNKVTGGVRYALTIAFSCDRGEAIPNPVPSRATTSAAQPTAHVQDRGRDS